MIKKCIFTLLLTGFLGAQSYAAECAIREFKDNSIAGDSVSQRALVRGRLFNDDANSFIDTANYSITLTKYEKVFYLKIRDKRNSDSVTNTSSFSWFKGDLNIEQYNSDYSLSALCQK